MAGGTFVCRDGKLVSSAALREGKARHSQWDGGNLDPDRCGSTSSCSSASIWWAHLGWKAAARGPFGR